MENKSPLDRIKRETKKDFQDIDWCGSFWEFEGMLKKDPKNYLRTAYQYLNDMINFFGVDKYEDCGEELIRYKVFDDPFDNGQHAVFGLDRVLMDLVLNIRTTAETGGEERILLLHGPVATSKTSIVNLITKGLEEYSKAVEGTAFSFSWVFANKSTTNVGFHLPHQNTKKRKESYANLPNKQLIADVPCQISDNPLLLIPKKYRKEYLEEIIRGSGQEMIIPKKILEGELCFNCQSIYSHLLDEYKGDLEQVLKHIRVDRLIISQVNQRGAAIVQPVDNMEGSSPIITWDGKEYAHLERLLRGIRLHKFMGKWADSNRGLIHFTDIFKKHSTYLQYLLSAAQEHMVDFNGVQGYVDAMIIGTTNRSEYKLFKSDENNAALDDRIRKTDIVYLTKMSDERKIYEKQLEEAGYSEDTPKEAYKHIAPHWLDSLALWVVLSRIEKPKAKNFEGKEISNEKIKAIADLSAYQKAKLYNGEPIPGLDRKQEAVLKEKYVQRLIRREHPLEGVQGVSPRVMHNLIIDILGKEQDSQAECLRVFKLFNQLEQLLEEDYEFLKELPVEGGYHHPQMAIVTIMHEYHEQIIKECKWAVIGMKEEAIEHKIREYIEHARAYVNNELITNPVTHKDERPSEDKMKWVEGRIGVLAGEKDEFRKDILKEAAYAAIDNPGEELDFKKVYSYLYKELETGLFEEKKKNLPISFGQMKYALSKYNTEQFEKLDKVHKKTVEGIIGSMVGQYGYCKYCGKDTLLYMIENNFTNPIALGGKLRNATAKPGVDGDDDHAEKLRKIQDLYNQLIKGGMMP